MARNMFLQNLSIILIFISEDNICESAKKLKKNPELEWKTAVGVEQNKQTKNYANVMTFT